MCIGNLKHRNITGNRRTTQKVFWAKRHNCPKAQNVFFWGGGMSHSDSFFLQVFFDQNLFPKVSLAE